MTKMLNEKGSGRIASVAFGSSCDSYFIVYAKNGGWCYHNVPQGLVDLLRKRQERTDLECVSWSGTNNGEWYISARMEKHGGTT
jgi:hypothetical protein